MGRGAQIADEAAPFARGDEIEDVVDARGDEHDASDAMDDAAEMLAHAEDFGEPGVRELERKAGDDKNNEAD